MSQLEMIIRGWRVTRGIPSGAHVWFDPKCENVKLYRVPLHDQRGSSADAPEVDEGGDTGYLDKVVSVSASGPGLGELSQEDFEQFGLLEEESELPQGFNGGSRDGETS